MVHLLEPPVERSGGFFQSLCIVGLRAAAPACASTIPTLRWAHQSIAWALLLVFCPRRPPPSPKFGGSAALPPAAGWVPLVHFALRPLDCVTRRETSMARR